MSTVAQAATKAADNAQSSEIEDVQGRPDKRHLAIDKVGIKSIRHPVQIKQRVGGEQHTVATFGMFVDLPHHFKGTHMSRFVEILNAHEHQITVASFREMLAEMTDRLEARNGHIKMEFPYFIQKQAPISGVTSVMDYEVAFLGSHVDGTTELKVQVKVPVTTLCPCSKQISKYGAHNQRSLVIITVRADEFFWLEELIDIAEAEASSELYGILKRVDEKEVTERAYDNPKFVEDLVRDVATRLNEDDRFRWYSVDSENFESIHNHSAYAFIEHDKDADNSAS